MPKRGGGLNAGGAVTAMNSNVVQILNSTIVHNQGTNGGGIYLNICNHTAINGNVYGYNRALKAGGAHWQTQCNGGPLAFPVPSPVLVIYTRWRVRRAGAPVLWK